MSTCSLCQSPSGQVRPDRGNAVLCDMCCQAVTLLTKATLEQIAALRSAELTKGQVEAA